MLERLIFALYVSASTGQGQSGSEAAEAIAWKSAIANAEAKITGALLYTGSHFAQALEGESHAVEALVSRLREDPAHESLKILRMEPIARRQFDGWSMAFPGPTEFLKSYLERLHRYPTRSEDVDRLQSIMHRVIADGAAGSSRPLLGIAT